MDKTIVLPAETVEMLDEIRTHLEAKTGISRLSRRQVIESLISQRMETLYGDLTLYRVSDIAPAESPPPAVDALDRARGRK
jgi:hypothetical protein